MDMIKRFITCYVPVHACNFRCSYCYLSHHKNIDAYGGGIKPLVMEPEKIAKSLSVERLGGVCYFNLCAAGETMLHKEIVPLVQALTRQGHYVDIVTNGTISGSIDKLIETCSDEQKDHIFIKFSLHYLQLLEKSLIATFVSNVNKIRNFGISYSIEVTPHDELVPYIDELKSFSMKEFGALPHITVARNEGTSKIDLLTKYSKEEYSDIWSTFDSKLFDFKLSVFNQRREEFCYAGSWSLAVNLEDGNYSQCYIGSRLGNIKEMDKPINFRPIGKCREPHCFNAHAFLAFGNIPEIQTPTYLEERDRVCEDGSHWVSEKMGDFFKTKTYQTNKKLTIEEQKKIKQKEMIYRFEDLCLRMKGKLEK